MLVEFTVENYRSIKDAQTFSMVAEATKYKRDTNTVQVSIGKDDHVQLLKSAVIFGANASGKSTFIKAFRNFKTIIMTTGRLPEGKPNIFYDPFLFEVENQEMDTRYECVFIIENIKYRYSISFNLYNITAEELNYYPKNVKKNLFKRIISKKGELADDVRLAKDVKGIDLKLFPEHFKVFKNQVILSKFGSEIPDKFFNAVYSYFEAYWMIWSENNSQGIEELSRAVITGIDHQLGDDFFKQVEKLVKAADTKIDGLLLKEEVDNGVKRRYLKHTPNNEQRTKHLFGNHIVYKRDKVFSNYELPFIEESAGTNVLFALGAYVLVVIRLGGVVFIDELDNSLHPKVARFLVSLFNNPTINKKNAQIIFSTHEAHLIDKDMFRSDQIWFANKKEKGDTEIYSAQDFNDIREDIPFDKWYLAGKFGALPDIKDIEYIFNDDEDGK
ncbi:AAA family ATPase [Chitinophaga agrisoli]|nr:ATP-binding protein [Chitinophaga agrisoli]